MSLTTFVIARELKTAPRRKRFYLKRTSIVIGLATIMLWVAHFGRQTQSTTLGLQIFTTLSYAALGGLSFITLAAAVHLITQEKEERTLGLLLLTEVSGWNIILGKLFTALFSASMVMLSILPLILLAVSLGGVSALQVFAALGVILTHALLVAGLGLLAGSMTRSDRTATGTAGLLWIGAFIIAPVLLAWAADEYNVGFLEPLVYACSPFVAMSDVVQKGGWAFAASNGVLSLLACLPVIIGSQRLIVRGAVSDSTRLGRSVQRRMAAKRGQRGVRRRAPLVGNPVFWRDYEFWLGGTRASWKKYLLCVIAITLMFVWFALASKSSAKDLLDIIPAMGAIISAGVLALGGVALCSQAFHKEKRFRALESLLTTDLADDEIIWGKAHAVFRSLMPWLYSTAIFMVLCVLRYGDEHEFWQFIFYAIVEYGVMAFAYCWLAFWLSMRFKRNVGFGIAVLVFIVWNSFGRLFGGVVLDIYDSINSVILTDVLVHAGMGATFMALSFATFRSRALAME